MNPHPASWSIRQSSQVDKGLIYCTRQRSGSLTTPTTASSVGLPASRAKGFSNMWAEAHAVLLINQHCMSTAWPPASASEHTHTGSDPHSIRALPHSAGQTSHLATSTCACASATAALAPSSRTAIRASTARSNSASLLALAICESAVAAAAAVARSASNADCAPASRLACSASLCVGIATLRKRLGYRSYSSESQSQPIHMQQLKQNVMSSSLLADLRPSARGTKSQIVVLIGAGPTKVRHLRRLV